MKTITHECYVSLEVAKLLKQAGFDWEVEKFYWYNKQERKYFLTTLRINEQPKSNEYFAPTMEVAQKWLRDVKGFEVTIDWSVIVNGKIVGFNGRGYSYHVESDDFADGSDDKFTSYEEAQEAGIQKCLTILLKKDKDNE